MFFENKKLKMLEEFKTIGIENINLPCKNCDGDCCGNLTPFAKEELNLIKKEYPNILKKYKILDTNIPNSYTLKPKGIKIDKCVFFKDNKCSIYKVRPKICKDFGEKQYTPCPFNNLAKKPDSKEEQDRLSEQSQLKAFSKMSEIAGIKINLIPNRAKNVFI